MKNTEAHGLSSGSVHGMEVNARILKITGWLTGVYFVIELGLGFYSKSVAVISDAFHTFSAVGGILIALAANKIASRQTREQLSALKKLKLWVLFLTEFSCS